MIVSKEQSYDGESWFGLSMAPAPSSLSPLTLGLHMIASTSQRHVPVFAHWHRKLSYAAMTWARASIRSTSSTSPLDLSFDIQQNRMVESPVLFKSVVSSRWFLRTSFILFLNKIDVFKAKLPKVPLERYFPEYTGGADITRRRSTSCGSSCRRTRTPECVPAFCTA
ncbi:putative heterotrimeric g-protein alpha gpa3-like protein [Lyophyllum shimeji]|uniref:Heterotrimeric g-protein alpha gpa3-like protein n=1 Tax=Lyophyllum shimeji TaxID=47721 RepID=A0A9P3PYI0_LYOSH|nr:putative heterotrimeric g-protein alpha gpa3-like protein [Lyophyllum shimeji]